MNQSDTRNVGCRCSRLWVVSLLLLVLVCLGGDVHAQISVPRDAVSGGGGAYGEGQDYSGTDIIAQSGVVGTSESESNDYVIQHGYLVEVDVFPNVSYSAGLTADSYARGVAWGDVDSNGYPDLYVTRAFSGDNQDYLYINNGNGTFTEDAVARFQQAESSEGHGIAFADYDGDGDFDAYVQNDPAAVGFLYRNDASGVFDEVFAEEGLEAATSVMPSWGDYDGDGLIDLFLANSAGGAPKLYQNTGNYAATGAKGFAKDTSAIVSSTTGVGAFADLNAYSEPIRPVIPIDSAHPFRGKAPTYSD